MMPPAKAPRAKPKAPDPPLDRTLDDEVLNEDTPEEPAEPEVIELRDDADEPIVVLSRSQVEELVHRAVETGVEGEAGPDIVAGLVDTVEFQELATAPSIAGTIGRRPDYRVAVGAYLAVQRTTDIRRPAQALAATASRAEEAVTGGIDSAADLLVVAVEPGRGRDAQALVEEVLGLRDPDDVQE